MLPNGSSACDNHERVAILDAGAQYGKVIDRRIRELNVLCELLPLETPAAELLSRGYKAIIISGGPGSVTQQNAIQCDPKLWDCGLPILGICYGMQLMNQQLGGCVQNAQTREDGQFNVSIDTQCPLFHQLQNQELVLLTHGDCVTKLSDNLLSLATADKLIVAIGNQSRRIYGVQFHPEVDLSPCGQQIFKNFLFNIAHLKADYKMDEREQICIKYIRESVPSDHKVLILLSGGVDSSTCAALLTKALRPEQIIAIHIDNGFMRMRESATVVKSLASLGVQVQLVDASLKFLSACTWQLRDMPAVNNKDAAVSQRKIRLGPLSAVTNPEDKRHIIGDMFMIIAQQAINNMGLNTDKVYLAQGTLRPDLIESASSIASNQADAIKTHHNDTHLVRQLRIKGRVIEPLKDFHKDEVRTIGRDLGLPESLVARQPFPGPGLAIRILCAREPHIDKDFNETSVTVKLLLEMCKQQQQHLDDRQTPQLAKLRQLLSDKDLQRLRNLPQLYSVLLPINSVGVQGDRRTYSYAVAISAVNQLIQSNWTELFYLANLIPRVCHNINRVVFVFGPVVQYNISDITPTLLCQPVIQQLREVDYAVNNVLCSCQRSFKSISQMPIVLLPIHFDRDPLQLLPSVQRSIVLRPFVTNDFMTGLPAIPGQHLQFDILHKMVTAAQSVSAISRVMYDLTSKPPGTTEWE